MEQTEVDNKVAVLVDPNDTIVRQGVCLVPLELDGVPSGNLALRCSAVGRCGPACRQTPGRG